MSTSEKIDIDVVGVPTLNITYKSMIGSLLYLTTSQLDVCFSVCACARYQSTPKESNVKVVKRIIRYVHRRIDLIIWFSKDSAMNFVSYSDANYVENIDYQKSTLGKCF